MKKSLFIGGLAIMLAITSVMFVAPEVSKALHPTAISTRVPLIRLYNPRINDHFYTNNEAEASTAQTRHGYVLESYLGYLESVSQNGTKQVYRMWNPRALKHFYTTDSGEASAAQSAGFVLEGTVGYIQTDTAPTSGDSAFAPPIETVSTSKYLYRMYNNMQSKHFYTINKTEMTSLQNRGYRLEGTLGILYSSLYDSTHCPDEWIINRMPSTSGSNAAEEYFIVNGSRVELEEYDVAWVERYCGLTKQEVY